MNILFLGTGTSTGVPSLCCDCEICRSSDPKNNRLRSSVLIRNKGFHILIDTSTDLRLQCLRYKVNHVDCVLYTHHHADHVHGIDELRSFNYFNGTVTPCYGKPETIREIEHKFNYIFNGTTQVGGGLPKLSLHPAEENILELGEMRVTPLEVIHGKLRINGYRVNHAAYITDCSEIPEATRRKMENLDLLILNALGFEPHATHFCLSQALREIELIKPKRALLTHINHKFDHDRVSADLPENVELAYDGMSIDL
ncbi:MAG: MBL fold metallo-hydrolase [Nitrospinae bacterium CG11_big_fil_rev_8_21_14_0_20_56_8]|nr:MAG: MBL fold metallo-hydrolase [Nitrospinae bacterium CG11_big_fil_rev_8_21_14_0_20_56_8]